MLEPRVTGLGGRGGDPDGRLPLPEDRKLRELPGQVLEGGLVLLVLKGEQEGLDVLMSKQLQVRQR